MVVNSIQFSLYLFSMLKKLTVCRARDIQNVFQKAKVSNTVIKESSHMGSFHEKEEKILKSQSKGNLVSGINQTQFNKYI